MKNIYKNILLDELGDIEDKVLKELLFIVEFKFDFLVSMKKFGKFSFFLISVVNNMN